jgi:hypothetical protein
MVASDEQPDVLEACREVGCSRAQSLDECLDCLLERVKDGYDPLHDRCCEVLRSVVATLDIKQVAPYHRALQRYCPQKGQATQNRYSHLFRPGPAWTEALSELKRAPRPDDLFQFVERLCEVFRPSAENVDISARRSFLSEHAALLQDVLDSFAQRQSVSASNNEPRLNSRQQSCLKVWLAEHGVAQIEASLAAAEQDPNNWARVAALADRYQDVAQRPEQHAMFRRAREDHRAFQAWHEELIQAIGTMEAYRFPQGPRWPWSDRTASIDPKRLLELAKPDRWRLTDDLALRLSQAASRLSKRALSEICGAAHAEPVNHLQCIESLRETWAEEALGHLPEHNLWELEHSRLAALVAADVQRIFKSLRDHFHSGELTRQALADHPQFDLIYDRAADEHRAFLNDLGILDRIERDMQHWLDAGLTAILDDGRLDEVKLQLDGLSAAWNRASGFARLQRAREDLERELSAIERARALLRDESNPDPEEVVRLLAPCKSAIAEELRKEAEQMRGELELIRRIEIGDLDAVKPAEVARASERVRTRYEGVRVGRRYLNQLRREAAALEGQPGNISALMDLSTRPPPDGAQYRADDRGELERLRERLNDRARERSERESQRLSESLQLFPLPEHASLVQRQERLAELDRVLAHGGFDPIAAARIRQTLEVVTRVTAVQVLASAGDWDSAAAALGEPTLLEATEYSQRRQLEAGIVMERLGTTRAPAEQWLALFHALPDVMLADQDRRREYLGILRKLASPGQDLGAARGTLEEYVPRTEATYLRQLLECMVNPKAVVRLSGEPEPEDLDALRRLVQDWSQGSAHYAELKRLWGKLDTKTRAIIWSDAERSPLEHAEAAARREVAALGADLLNPEVTIGSLQDRLARLLDAGLISSADEISHRIDRAVRVEHRLRELARLDPWGQELQPLVERTGRELDEPMATARGWSEQIRKRSQGQDAWRTVEDAWEQFRHRFDGKHTGPEPKGTIWQPLQEILTDWLTVLNRECPRIDWQLPRAHESSRWQHLLDAWRRSPEGALSAESGAQTPADLDELREAYERVLAQTVDMAQLNGELYDTHWKRKLARDSKSGRSLHERLMQIQPLCGPVKDIRQHWLHMDTVFSLR